MSVVWYSMAKGMTFYLYFRWALYGNTFVPYISFTGRCVAYVSGVGYGMVILSLIVAIYYNVVMAYTLYYFVASFHETLPWTLCGQVRNTPN